MRLFLAPLVFLSLAASLQAAYTPKQWAKELKTQTAAFKKADKDRDETISQEEFLQLLNPKTKEVTKRAGSHAQQFLEETANVFFEWFDEDVSGDIDLEEWLTARTANPHGSTPNLLDIPQEVIDRNLNGNVTIEEFQWIVQSYVSPALTKIWHQRITAAITSSGYNDTMGGSTNATLTVVGPGTSGVTHMGSGTLTLGGTNTYTGSTTVNDGSILGSSSSYEVDGSTDLTKSGSGTLTLGGSGTFGGTSITTGTLAPGTGVVTIGSGSTFGYELNSSSLNGDLLVGSGTLNLEGGAQLDLSTLLSSGSQLTLINYAGTWNGGTFEVVTDDSTVTSGSNNTWQFDYNDTTAPQFFVHMSAPISTNGTTGTTTVILPSGGTAPPVFQPTSTP